MLENRPIVAITIGYIIGIIMGLYLKKSIVLLYFLCFIIYLIFKKPPTKKFKLISYRRYFRYVKLVLTKKVAIIILVSSIISNSLTLYKNAQYNSFENKMDGQEMQIKAKVISNGNVKKYKKIYVAKLQNKKFYINVSKKTNLDYGNIIKLKGTYTKPNTRTNYKGFDYEEYLKKAEPFRKKPAASDTAPKQEKQVEYKKKKELDSQRRKARARLGRLEKEISDAEDRLSELNDYLNSPEVSSDYERLMKTTDEISQTESALEVMYEEWEELSELTQE